MDNVDGLLCACIGLARQQQRCSLDAGVEGPCMNICRVQAEFKNRPWKEWIGLRGQRCVCVFVALGCL